MYFNLALDVLEMRKSLMVISKRVDKCKIWSLDESVWLIVRSVDWPIYLLVEWLIDWSIDWLADWLIVVVQTYLILFIHGTIHSASTPLSWYLGPLVCKHCNQLDDRREFLAAKTGFELHPSHQNNFIGVENNSHDAATLFYLIYIKPALGRFAPELLFRLGRN